MLIDCGIHSSITGGTDKIRGIVDDIASLTKGKIDVLVLTHEHWDHNSGFLAANDKFKEFNVGEIWLGWTENPADPQAREFDKFKGQALAALQGAGQRLAKSQGLSAHLSNVQRGLQSVIGFNFGAKGEKVRDARNAAVGLVKNKDNVKYFEPKTAPFTLPVVPNVRVYVLGPPRDTAMFGITERPSEMYGMGASAGWPMANALNNAFAMDERELVQGEDITAPFDPNEGFDLSSFLTAGSKPPTEGTERERYDQIAAFIREHYTGTVAAKDTPAPASSPKTPGGGAADQSWRRIDGDWLGVSADLAIQLDNRTNNSSLVLAFEFVDSERVMLFVGDAQVGNWLSWKDVKWVDGTKTVTAHDLLARTVFYKVGHHGSDNATLKQNGLELMTSPDLSAFIPTNEKDALKVKWGAMPFKPILDDLEKRATHRVIRADDIWIGQATGQPGFQTPSGAIQGLRHDDKNGLWVELDIG